MGCPPSLGGVPQFPQFPASRKPLADAGNLRRSLGEATSPPPHPCCGRRGGDTAGTRQRGGSAQLQAPRIVSLGDRGPSLAPPGQGPGVILGTPTALGASQPGPNWFEPAVGTRARPPPPAPSPGLGGRRLRVPKILFFSPLMGPKIVGSSPFGAVGAPLGLGFSPAPRTRQKLGHFGGCFMIYRSQLQHLIPSSSAGAAPGRKGEPGARPPAPQRPQPRLRPPSRRPPAALGLLRAPRPRLSHPRAPHGTLGIPRSLRSPGGPARSQAPPPFSSPRPFPGRRQAPTDDVSSGAREDTPLPAFSLRLKSRGISPGIKGAAGRGGA